MGYYTSHELEVIEGDDSLIGKLRDGCEDAAYALDENGGSEESCKWYNHDIDMRKFSEKHPEALFRLSGEGEEAGDIWHEYYRAGKQQVCKARIVMPNFDADLLL